MVSPSIVLHEGKPDFGSVWTLAKSLANTLMVKARECLLPRESFTIQIEEYTLSQHDHDRFDPRLALALSIQRALLDNVVEPLVAVTCGIHDNTITVRAFFDRQVTSSDVERLQYVSTEVIADFPEGYFIHEECLSMEDSKLEMLDFWAFRRAGLAACCSDTE